MTASAPAGGEERARRVPALSEREKWQIQEDARRAAREPGAHRGAVTVGGLAGSAQYHEAHPHEVHREGATPTGTGGSPDRDRVRPPAPTGAASRTAPHDGGGRTGPDRPDRPDRPVTWWRPSTWSRRRSS